MILRATAALLSLASSSAAALEPGSYEITAQTVMPHLEEALRYATTRERRCLNEDDLASVFPILSHDSLAGCRLGDAHRNGTTLLYSLACASPQTATGVARLDATPDRIAGSLEIKMGGKNMTFSQRIDAVRRGDCE
jgi:hypothetical protein